MISLMIVSFQVRSQHHIVTDNNLKIQSDSMKFDSLLKEVERSTHKFNEQKLSNEVTTAEGLLTKQNFLIQGFGTLFTVISVLIVVVTLFTYFFNIRPLTRRAERAVETAETAVRNMNERVDNFNIYIEKTFDSKFETFEKKITEERLDKIFEHLCSNFTFQRNLALESLSALPTNSITLPRIYQLFNFLSQPQLTEAEKIAVIEKLIQIDKSEIRTFFMSWNNVKPDNHTLKNFLLKFYIQKGFSNFLQPVTNFILNYSPQREQFNNYCALLSSLDPSGIVQLINFQPLVNGMNNESKKEICKYLNSYKDIWNLKQEIDTSLLCKNEIAV